MASQTEVTSLCEKFFDWRLRESPEFASFCGFHQHDDRLGDMTVEAHERRGKECEEMLKQAVTLNSSSLSEEDQVNLMLLRDQLSTFIQGIKFQGYLNQLHTNEGIHVEFDSIISWMKFENVEDFQKYVRRLRSLVERVKQTENTLQVAVKLGKTNNVHSMGKVPDTIRALLKDNVEESLFFEPLKEMNKISEDDRILIQRNAKEVIQDGIYPAFKNLLVFLEEVYMKNLRPGIGVSSWPDGHAFYTAVLQWHLTLDMTPQQVHQVGLDEVARIKAQMMQIIEKTHFQGDFKEFVQYLRQDEKFYYNSKEELLDGFRDICYNKIRPKLGSLFHKIPASQLIVSESPPSKPHAPAGYYLAGTLDGSRPGQFYVNCCNLKLTPKYEMMTLSLHEGEPGHHFQGMYAIEMKGVPAFRQYFEDMYYYAPPSRFPMYTAYVGGWGLYCEYLGNELGLYEDPYAMFGHLSFEMHRACRLVADTGIHAFGWTREQAISLFLENTALSEAFIQSEVNRYITWPGQACGYKIGQMKIKELRAKATQALGSKFCVKDFHEEVLKCGMVPMNVLENVIDKYVAQRNTMDS